MRDLLDFELAHVTGAGASPCPPAGKDKKHKKAKGNNGFGNGGDDPAPGNSGKTGADKEADEVR